MDTYLKQHAHDVDAPATAVEDVWEWPLSRWTDPPPGGQTYELSEKHVGGDDAMAMLVKDKTFLDYLLGTTVTPTHLTSTGSAVSPDDTVQKPPDILFLILGLRSTR